MIKVTEILDTLNSGHQFTSADSRIHGHRQNVVSDQPSFDQRKACLWNSGLILQYLTSCLVSTGWIIPALEYLILNYKQDGLNGFIFLAIFMITFMLRSPVHFVFSRLSRFSMNVPQAEHWRARTECNKWSHSFPHSPAVLTSKGQ